MPEPREPIFRWRVRTDTHPSYYAESTYKFLDRVPGEYWDQVRALIQTWANQIEKQDDYRDVKARIQSGKEAQLQSALLELYIHEVLLRAGFDLQVHPPVAGSTRRPDFLASSVNEKAYVEVIAPSKVSETQRAGTERLNTLIDTVNRLSTTRFSLHLRHVTQGTQPPPGSLLRKQLRRWLDDLEAQGENTYRNNFVWNWNDWSLHFGAFARTSDQAFRCTSPQRAIAVSSHNGVRKSEDSTLILDALKEKGRAYGELDAAFVVVVGSHARDILGLTGTALYGGGAASLTFTDREAPNLLRRDTDPGYFGKSPEWSHQNMSGLVVVDGLQPWTVATASAAVWHHPKPSYQMPSIPIPAAVSVSLVNERFVVRSSDVLPTQFFALSDPWPLGDAWPD